MTNIEVINEFELMLTEQYEEVEAKLNGDIPLSYMLEWRARQSLLRRQFEKLKEIKERHGRQSKLQKSERVLQMDT